MPDEHASHYLAELVVAKDPSFEAKVCRDIARMLPSFAFGKSKWNNQKHAEKKCVFRMSETIHYNEDAMEEESMSVADNESVMTGSVNNNNTTTLSTGIPAPNKSTASIAPIEEDVKSVWNTVLYQEKSCYVMNLKEKSHKYSEDLLAGVKV